jgi:two-component system, response regulator
MTKPKILIVEDDDLLTNMYKTKFAAEGFDVITAGDGEEGLQKMKEHNLVLVIMDIMMPKLSGIQLLELAKKDSALSKIPILMLSNLGSVQQIEKAKKLGAVNFLIKANYTPNQIISYIKKMLHKKK